MDHEESAAAPDGVRAEFQPSHPGGHDPDLVQLIALVERIGTEADGSP
jgi:hypothetical protein